MLPLSCFLFELSKSNSSTRDPSTTTTRVSSAWAASMSIFFDIQGISAARSIAGAQPLLGGRARTARDDCVVPGGLKRDRLLSAAHSVGSLVAPLRFGTLGRGT